MLFRGQYTGPKWFALQLCKELGYHGYLHAPLEAHFSSDFTIPYAPFPSSYMYINELMETSLNLKRFPSLI